MKKILKWLFAIIFILLVLIIALPFIFKGKIIEIAKKEANNSINAKVEFGEMDIALLSSFPYFTFSIEDVSIVGINEFEGDTLIASDKIALSLNLMSVIKGDEYEIRSIELDHARILAKVLKDGKANWDIAKAGKEEEGASEETADSKFSMKLKSLTISRSNIVYDDAPLGFYLALIGFDHELSGDFTESNFLLETFSTIKELTVGYEGVNYLYKLDTEIDADMDVDMDAFKFTFKDNKFRLNALSLGLDGFFAMPGDDMEMDLKFKANESEFKNFLSLIPAAYSSDFDGVKTTGKLALDGFVKGVYNDNKMPAFMTRVLVTDASFQYPSLPKSAENIQIDLMLDNKTGDPDNTVINLKKFHVELGGNPLDANLYVVTPVSDANVKGNFKGSVDLDGLKDVMPLDADQQLNGKITSDLSFSGKMSSIENEKYEEFSASGGLTVNGMKYKSNDLPYEVLLNSMKLTFTPRFVELADFDAKAGGSDFRASGKIENFMEYAFKEELLKGYFSLSSNSINVDELMGSDEDGDGEEVSSDTSTTEIAEVPSNIDFVLNTDIGNMLYDGLEMKSVSGKVTIRNSIVSMDHLRFEALDGSMDVSGTYSTQDPKKPKTDLKLSLKNLDIQKTNEAFVTVKKLAPVAKHAYGKFSTNMSFSCELDNNMEPIMSTLNGNGTLSTNNVEVKGYEPLNKLGDALKMDKFKQMNFSDLTIAFQFSDGKVTVDPFEFKANSFKGTMGGSTGFDQSLDYLMDLQIPRSQFGGKANAALEGLVSKANSSGANVNVGEVVNIQALLRGTVLKPSVSTNIKGAANDAMNDLKDKAKDELEKRKKEAEEKAKAEAERLKNEAEGKAKAEAEKLKAEAEKAKMEAEAKAKAEAEKAKKEAEEKAKEKLKGLIKKK